MNSRALLQFPLATPTLIAGIDFAQQIVGLAGRHVDLMTVANEPVDDGVDLETLGPEVLCDDENPQRRHSAHSICINPSAPMVGRPGSSKPKKRLTARAIERAELASKL